MEKTEKKLDLTSVITTAIQVPGVKVNRNTFLKEQFKELPPSKIELILEQGPVAAGCSREELKRKANRIVKECTAVSTGASFLAGLPGGIAMAATIPADIMQFYGVALRMAQQLVYLYGEEDMWCDAAPDPDKITNQLILYCGVMLGVSGAAQTVRIMSGALAKQVAKKLPQKALTKTFYYPVIKSILKFFGVSVTKSTFAKGVSKVIPFVGGVVSGGLTLVSMTPMGNRLVSTLDQTHFDYSAQQLEADLQTIEGMQNDAEEEDGVTIEATYEETPVATQEQPHESPVTEPVSVPVSIAPKKEVDEDELYAKLKRAKRMFEEDLITEEEFKSIKQTILSQL